MPVNLRAKGATRFAASPMISDCSCEPVVFPKEFILRSSTERQKAPRSAGGSSPSHLPAAQETAISVTTPACSSLARWGSLSFRFQVLADSMAFFEPESCSTIPDPLDAGGDGGVCRQLLVSQSGGIVAACRNRSRVVVLRLGAQRLSGILIFRVHKAGVVVVHVGVGISRARDRRVNARGHVEGPLVGTVVPGAKFEPGRRANAASGQLYHFYVGVVEVIVDPVGVAVEILHRVQGGAQCDQGQDLAGALV